jgi:hypothetical protein
MYMSSKASTGVRYIPGLSDRANSDSGPIPRGSQNAAVLWVVYYST